MLSDILEKRLIPVAVIDNVEHAIPLAEALITGGLSVIEVTLRTEAALKSIHAIKTSVPDMLVGAGTILDPALIPKLVDLGVSFGISPGINTRVIEAADKHQLTMMPGVVTPTEIEQARNYGLSALKFFPAEAAGGATLLKAIVGPYGHTDLRFIPTGGINMSNMMDYLQIPIVAAIGGSWFVDKNLISNGKFTEITQLTLDALNTIRSI